MIREEVSHAISRTILIYSIDLLQVDLPSFLASGERALRLRSGQASDEVTRGRLVSIEGLPFCVSRQTWGEA